MSAEQNVHSKSRGLSKFETVLDKAHDLAQNVTTKGLALQGTASPVFSAAYKAMANVQGSGFEAKTAQDLLEPVKKVMDALTVLGQVHPFIGVVVVAASALISFEIKRRDNDKKIAALLLKQSDMLLILLQLKDVQDPTIPGPNGETIRGRLQGVFEKINSAITKCGNAIDSYYKQQFLVKFFKSPSWQDTFVAVAGDFESCKSELQFSLSIHMATTLDKAANRLDQVDIKVTALLDIFQHKSDLEKEMSAAVASRGGVEKCLASEDALNELLPIAKTGDSSSIQYTDSNVDSTLLFTLKSSLEDILKNNEPIFESKLNIQTKLLQDTIKSSEDRILRALGGGDFYKRVIHNDVRIVWREMGWRLSADAHTFVFAIHDFYLERIAFGLNADAYFNLSSAESATDEDAAKRAAEQLQDIQRLQEDKWCVEYLKTYYVPAISEVIDDDLSGLVKITEINEFTESRPEGWSLLNWLSFWSVGWQLANTWYHARIESLLDRMHGVVVLEENSEFVNTYLDSSGIFIATVISRGNRAVTSTGSVEIVGLVRKWMDTVEGKLEKALKNFRYEIDAPETLALLFENQRLELLLLPLYYLILRRHYQVIRLSTNVVADDKEFANMRLTLLHVVNAVLNRRYQLQSCFYAQKLDVNDSFEHFANGMFSGIWNGKSYVSFNSWAHNGDYCMPYEAPQDEILEKTTAHIDKEEIDLPVSDLKYPLHSPWNASPANGDGIPSSQRRYMDLYDRKLEQTLYSDDDRDIFTVEDEKELDEMDRVLSAEDVEKFKVSTMQERRSVAIHPILCGTPGCRTNRPIIGTRVKCLDCEACTICSACQANPAKYDEEHRVQHNFMEFPRAVSGVSVFRFIDRAEKLAVKVAKLAGEQPEPTVLIACAECPYRAREVNSKEFVDTESLVHSPKHVILRIRNLFGDDLHQGNQEKQEPSPNATADILNPEPKLDEGGIATGNTGDGDSAPADLRAWISERMSKLEQNMEDRLAKLESLLQGRMAQEL